MLPDRKDLSSEHLFSLVFFGVCFKKVPEGFFLFIPSLVHWQMVSCGVVLVLYVSYTAM